ncbi:zinc-binding dehydrogenase [Nesterenkonia sp. NBAIMH1]|uniref:zinc-binding dehydrogenase n=1 Tax=Nesterenkonia sp. NBAIMH1 TaxID=2600320 RepID=UPI0011B45D57|nr:zinc-binding dehydrogenase [Nesterenkonia sp. NBAIMH1]
MISARAAFHPSPAARELTVDTVEVAEPGPGLVRVRLGASGVCGSDRHVLDGEWSMPSPTVLGHEGAGTVESMGEGVTDLEEGDHVIITWFQPCLRCSSCAEGRTWVCDNASSEGCRLPDGSTPLRKDDREAFPYLAVGSMAEYAVVPRHALVPISREVPFDVAALIGCSVVTGFGAVVNDAGVQAGRSALVIGAGGVGLSLIMSLVAAGAGKIIAADINPEALALAEEFGATHTVLSNGDLPDKVREITGHGVDYAFEAIGRPETIGIMPDCVRRGGKAVIVGLPPEDAPVSVDALALAEQGKTLIGSNYGSTVPPRDFPLLAQLYLSGRLPIDRLITRRFALEDVNEAFSLMRAGAAGRSVIVY